MKVYMELPTESRGLQRVYDAFLKYSPKNIEFTKNPKIADLTIVHVIGRYEHVKRKVDSLRAKGMKYSMIQYCIRSTMKPNTYDWIEMWKDAEIVWSYYNLWKLYEEDINKKEFIEFPPQGFKLYHAPLGVETDVFQDRSEGRKREFIITVSSKHALSEGTREACFAAKRLGKKVFHLGHELRRGSDIVCLNDISDYTLSHFYSNSVFVSGLRRCEGFEQPVIEGLMCGARPIVYDRPEMRQWFGDLAIFIKEEDRPEVIDSLEREFRRGAFVVSEEEKAIAKKRFNWQTIIDGFWKNIN